MRIQYMTSFNKKEPLVLFLGDIVAFYLALWLMLLVRYQSLPTKEALDLHLSPFSILFLVWIIVFFIAGLYEKHTLILKSRIGNIILNAQIANSFLAALFFYVIPYFGIAPKTNLFIDLVFSFTLIVTWRLYVFPTFQVSKKENAILVGTGAEMRELESEVNNNPRYDLQFISSIDLDQLGSIDFKEEILNRIYSNEAFIVAADFRNEKVEPLLPKLYSLIFSKVKFLDIHKLYEDIFDRIPLSLTKYNWFFENISSTTQKNVYDFLKRGMDLVLSLVLGFLSLVLYPFVYLSIKLDDGGPIFFTQERVGQNGQTILVKKFRSLAVHNDVGGIATDPKPTRVGKFLRKVRIDELPQLWNVLYGDLSLIGPRPEIPALARLYGKEIPYYNVRHLVKPGLSGWAQLYQAAPPKFAVGYDETRTKLSYDLYYIKNRSFMLDLKIALRTIKTLLSREGV
jgi:exopolysaccharide biosynthesis polyprenyl glycosylphosphotransferase